MTSRTELHDLVDELPDRDLDRALTLLRALNDPVLRLFGEAPEDDEELSPAGEQALNEGLHALERGDVVSHEEARRQLGG